MSSLVGKTIALLTVVVPLGAVLMFSSPQGGDERSPTSQSITPAISPVRNEPSHPLNVKQVLDQTRDQAEDLEPDRVDHFQQIAPRKAVPTTADSVTESVTKTETDVATETATETAAETSLDTAAKTAAEIATDVTTNVTTEPRRTQ